jgi:diguanylate cyclase (GGDEF)-like protein
MEDPFRSSSLARLAGGFFAVAGLVAALNAWMPLGELRDPGLLAAVGVGASAAALVCFLLRWDELPRGAMFAIVVAALALKAVGTYARGPADAQTYTVHYLVLYMWIGIALPRWGWIASIPLLLVALSSPVLLSGAPLSELRSVVILLPACAFVGGGAAWLSGRLRDAERVSEQRAERMSRLVDATLALASSQEIDELGCLTAVGANDLFDGRGALVMLADDVLGLRKVGEDHWPESRTPDADCIAALAEWLRGWDDHAQDPAASGWLARRLGVPALEVLALQGTSGAVGVVLVDVEQRIETERLVAYLARTLGTQAGLGFERIRSAQALLDDSLRDPLTGIGNRRKAMAALDLLKVGDAVALIDLDLFKDVNDNYGHAAGDRVLKTLADFLRHSVRGPDEVFRFGGEEFLIVLQGSGGSGLPAIERLQRAWNGQKRVTSFSAGVALHAVDDDPEETVARADGALYRAKRGGRNRVMLAGPEREPRQA